MKASYYCIMRRPNNSFYEIVNKSSADKSVDVLLYGFIPTFDWDTYEYVNTSDRFVKDFKALEESYDRINIHINSGGGSLYHAMPIINIIAASKKDVHTYNDGIAYSAAGLILFAGKTVHAAKNSMVMIHTGSSWAEGNAQTFREMADLLDKYDSQIAESIADKVGMTAEEVKEKWLNYKDNFFTAKEAQEAGLVDVIEDYKAESLPDDVSNMSVEDLLALANRPAVFNAESGFEKMARKLANHLRDIFPTNQKSIIKPENKDEMDFKNSLALLDAGNLTPENIATIKAEIAQFTGENEKFSAAEVEAKVKEANEAKAAADAAKAKAEEELATANASLAAATAELEKLKNEAGTPPSSTRKSGQEKLEDDEDDVQAILDSLPHNQKYDQSQY